MNQETLTALAPEAGLSSLAERSRGGDRAARAELQDRLAGSLAPAVRLALRRGVGRPSLVRWVRRTYASLAPDLNSPPERYAPQIVRLLCCALAQGLTASPA